MNLSKIGIYSWGLFLIFLTAVSVFTWSCSASNPTSNTPAPVVTILVTNNSSYPVTMSMDGGTAVGIAASGGSHSFTSTSAGSHSFSASCSQEQSVYTTTVCPGTLGSCNSTALSLGQQYVINISNSGSTTGCGPAGNQVYWLCP